MRAAGLAVRVPYPLVEVEWTDSTSIGRWSDLDYMDGELLPILSVGWLVTETKTSVTLVGSVGFEKQKPDSCNGDITIPKVAITARRTLRRA